MMHPTDKPQTRRNGKLQSCEPCRKSKLRCDHARPICQRCMSRGINQQCFYHPSPMTKTAGINRDRRSSEPQGRQLHAVKNSRPRSSLDTGRISTSESPALEFSGGSPGYLGSTSYSAVLTEHRGDIPLDVDGLPDSDNAMRIVNQERVQAGMNVLALWYNLPLCEALVRKHYQSIWCHQLSSPIMELALSNIRDVFNAFSAEETESRLREFSSQIFRNSSRPLKCHQSMTVEEYSASFSGQNCRWEIIGLLFAISGISLMTLADNDPLVADFPAKSGAKDRLMTQICEASSLCIGFCDHAASPNEILAWAQNTDVMLRTQQYGDSSYQAWRRLGDLSATVYAAGLHKLDGPADEECPFFVKQLRRSCFASAFYIDKTVATFVGRPPLINYRYCSLVPPLDLSDDILYGDESTLNAAIGQLDASGWHRSGSEAGRRVGLLRLKMQLALSREEVLELALGDYQQDVPRKAERILRSAIAAWDACPDYLKYNRIIETDKSQQNNTDTPLFVMYLDYLYTQFLLHRTVAKYSDEGHAPLFEMARQLLSTVVKVFAIRYKPLDRSGGVSWIILYYGLPSASSLAFEILRQTQHAGPHLVPLPRAEVIRNLSIFVSCLSWAALPFHGNYRMCKEAEQKLSHVLDKILDPPASLPQDVTLVDDVATDLGAFLDWNPNINWDFNTGIFSL